MTKGKCVDLRGHAIIYGSVAAEAQRAAKRFGIPLLRIDPRANAAPYRAGWIVSGLPHRVRGSQVNEVQALLLRINSEAAKPGAPASDLGAVLARYEKEEMPERLSTARIQIQHQNPIPPTMAETHLAAMKVARRSSMG